MVTGICPLGKGRNLVMTREEMYTKGRHIRVHKLPLPKPAAIIAEECGGLDVCWDEPAHTPGEGW